MVFLTVICDDRRNQFQFQKLLQAAAFRSADLRLFAETALFPQVTPPLSEPQEHQSTQHAR
jgi:hypothetical protein